MLKTIFLLVLGTICIQQVSCQINKGVWLIGGAGTFSQSKHKTAAGVQNITSIKATPSIGYFIADNFSAGVKTGYTFVNNNQGNNNTQFGYGPFVRYYVKQAEHVLNLFTEAAYSYVTVTGNTQEQSFYGHNYSFSAGPVYYFNSTVGLEFEVTYSITKFQHYEGLNKELGFGIGFQFYFEKQE